MHVLWISGFGRTSTSSPLIGLTTRWSKGLGFTYGSSSSEGFGNESCHIGSPSLQQQQQRLGNELRSSFSSEGSVAADNKYGDFTREAVLRVLLEPPGLSREDAEIVVSRAPVYIRELAEFYAELESDSSTAADQAGGATLQLGGFSDSRDRIYQMVNRGRGMSPFLESLGVPLSNIARISSSFSSERLADLMNKVRYFEELMKESGPRDRHVEGLVQFMMKNLSIAVWEDEDIQRTLSFFEKIRHQEGGLGALENSNSALPLFLEAFPQIFKQSHEHELESTVSFLEDLGVKGDNLRKVILCFPPILLQDPEKDLVPRKRTLKKVGIRVADMGRMVVKYPWLLSKCVGNNTDRLFQFMESVKVPKAKIDRAVTKCPHLLGCSCSDKFDPIVHRINGYGLKSKRLGRAIAQSPEMLLRSPDEFDTLVTFLGSVGVEAMDVSKLLRRAPEIVGSSVDSTLQKKVEVLEDLGVRRKNLGRIVWFFPEILSMSVESALLPRIQCLRDWGFAKEEISRMAFKFPPLLGYTAEAVVNPKLEFLTATMRRSIKDVVAYPRYFSHSLEKKIRPRARVLQNRQIECDLKTMLAKSDDKFAAEFLGVQSMFIPTIK